MTTKPQTFTVATKFGHTFMTGRAELAKLIRNYRKHGFAQRDATGNRVLVAGMERLTVFPR